MKKGRLYREFIPEKYEELEQFIGEDVIIGDRLTILCSAEGIEVQVVSEYGVYYEDYYKWDEYELKPIENIQLSDIKVLFEV